MCTNNLLFIHPILPHCTKASGRGLTTDGGIMGITIIDTDGGYMQITSKRIKIGNNTHGMITDSPFKWERHKKFYGDVNK